MSFPKLKLKQINSKLAESSWETFLQVFRVVAESNSEHPSGSQLFDLLKSERIGECFELIEFLSSQLYKDAAQYFAVTQFISLIKKYDFPPRINPFNPKEQAISKFFEAERHCSSVNEGFRNGSIFNDPFISTRLWRMRHWVQYVLGDFPSLSTVYDASAMGPGASIGVHGNATNLGRKFLSDSWSVSPSAFHYSRAMMISDPHSLELLSKRVYGKPFVCFDIEVLRNAFTSSTQLVNYNKIAFVPKTAKTFRSIAVEPLLNSMLQKGIDKLLRQRLKRVGLNLSEQKVNSVLAREGSLDDTDEGFCTIDLASASDSISVELARFLLPPDWFDFMNQIRSHNFSLDKKVHRYEKFCSMGNGFCFPLETLFFAASCVASGARPHDYVVYGDDIVLRKKFAPETLSLLQAAGFSINPEKTFLSGPFRESCGTDWWLGSDVRPYTLDHRLDSLGAYFKFLNLTQRNQRTSVFFEETREFLFSRIPRDFRYVRPFQGPSDTAVTVALDKFQSSPFAKWNLFHQCWEWRELVHVPLEDKKLKEHAFYGSAVVYGLVRGITAHLPFAMRRMTRTKTRRVFGSGDREIPVAYEVSDNRVFEDTSAPCWGA